MSLPQNGRALAAGAALAVMAATTALAAPLTIDGAVTGNSAGTFSIAQLQGLGSTTQTLGGDTYTGVSLWTLLGGNTSNTSTNIVVPGGGNNAFLRSVVTATGADGRTSTLSGGEFSVFFGTPLNNPNGPQYIVAYQKNGQTLATPTLVVGPDASGARGVAELTNLTVKSLPSLPAATPAPSTNFALTGVATPGSYDLAALQAMTPTTVTGVTYFQGQNMQGPFTFTGVSLWAFLTEAGIGAFDALTDYLVITATDGYRIVLSLAEINPDFTDREYLIAYGVDGANLGGNGFVRLVLPGDYRGGRYISNITGIDVRHAVPAPALAMLLAGAGLFLAAARRRGIRHGHSRPLPM